jgi:anti-sigma B factor antagonist
MPYRRGGDARTDAWIVSSGRIDVDFSIAVFQTGPVVRLELRGEIDTATVGQVHDSVIALVARLRPKEVAVDCRHVALIDSSGIGTLVACHKTVEAGGGTLRLINVSPFVRRQLFVTGLLGLFGLSPGLAAAGHDLPGALPTR